MPNAGTEKEWMTSSETIVMRMRCPTGRISSLERTPRSGYSNAQAHWVAEARTSRSARWSPRISSRPIVPNAARPITMAKVTTTQPTSSAPWPWIGGPSASSSRARKRIAE